jgi:predicted Fe-Mo cluster-binding NifX family protein
MRIAIPLEAGKVSEHFGHCEIFRFYDCAPDGDPSKAPFEDLTPPPHEPGVLPRFLAERGAEAVLAGGMGPRAVDLLRANRIQVRTGNGGRDPLETLRAFLAGGLSETITPCEHGDSDPAGPHGHGHGHAEGHRCGREDH